MQAQSRAKTALADTQMSEDMQVDFDLALISSPETASDSWNILSAYDALVWRIKTILKDSINAPEESQIAPELNQTLLNLRYWHTSILAGCKETQLNQLRPDLRNLLQSLFQQAKEALDRVESDRSSANNENDEPPYAASQAIRGLRVTVQCIVDLADNVHDSISSVATTLRDETSSLALEGRDHPTGVEKSSLNEDRDKRIILADHLGRRFTFPLQVCKPWTGMEKLIKQAFSHIKDPNIESGSYDLIGPDGSIIIPQVWEYVIGGGMEIKIVIREKDPDTKAPLSREGKYQRLLESVGRIGSIRNQLAQELEDIALLLKGKAKAGTELTEFVEAIQCIISDRELAYDSTSSSSSSQDDKVRNDARFVAEHAVPSDKGGHRAALIVDVWQDVYKDLKVFAEAKVSRRDEAILHATLHLVEIRIKSWATCIGFVFETDMFSRRPTSLQRANRREPLIAVSLINTRFLLEELLENSLKYTTESVDGSPDTTKRVWNVENAKSAEEAQSSVSQLIYVIDSMEQLLNSSARVELEYRLCREALMMTCGAQSADELTVVIECFKMALLRSSRFSPDTRIRGGQSFMRVSPETRTNPVAEEHAFLMTMLRVLAYKVNIRKITEDRTVSKEIETSTLAYDENFDVGALQIARLEFQNVLVEILENTADVQWRLQSIHQRFAGDGRFTLPFLPVYVGHFKDQEDRIRLVLKPPGSLEFSKDDSLESLLHAYSSSMWPIAARLQLAQALSLALIAFHAGGIIHRNFRSDILLVREDAFTRQKELVCVSGLSETLPSPLADSLDSEVTPNRDRSPYIHPNFVDGAAYTWDYAYYSLGVILVELAFWEPIGKVFSTASGEDMSRLSTRQMRSYLLDDYRIKATVQAAMGDSYFEATRACLLGVEWDAGEKFKTKSPTAAQISATFYEKVVHKLS